MEGKTNNSWIQPTYIVETMFYQTVGEAEHSFLDVESKSRLLPTDTIILSTRFGVDMGSPHIRGDQKKNKTSTCKNYSQLGRLRTRGPSFTHIHYLRTATSAYTHTNTYIEAVANRFVSIPLWINPILFPYWKLIWYAGYL